MSQSSFLYKQALSFESPSSTTFHRRIDLCMKQAGIIRNFANDAIALFVGRIRLHIFQTKLGFR